MATLAPIEVPATDIPESLPTEEPPTATPVPIEEPTLVPIEEPTLVPIEEPTTVPTEEPTTETPDLTPTEEPPATTSPVVAETVAYSFDGVLPLANGYHYEGWAIVDGEPVSTGKFNVNEDGELVGVDQEVSAISEFTTGTDLSQATAIEVTIEPPGDSDESPSSVKFLSGGVEGDPYFSADLTVNSAAALGDDFTGASGTFILATPTDDDEGNETSGIWFIDLSGGDPGPGLQLPELSEGFEYEGWVIIDDVPVSTGKFRDLAAADSGDPYSGPNPGQPFPGEDFLENAPEGLTFPADIQGKQVVISIEPVPDNSPDPFVLKPLIGEIPESAESQFNYALDNQAAGFPGGVVDIK
jgi:hypothetical protein